MKSQQTQGFTLIEVLVALAIVAITLGAGMRVSGGQISNINYQSALMRAQWCADNELVRLRLTRQLPDTGTQSFECTQANQAFVGSVIVSPTPNPSFRRVQALVYENADALQRDQALVRLTTLIGRF